MKGRRRILAALEAFEMGKRALDSPRYRMMLAATASLLLNGCYGMYHGILGLMGRSWLFIALSGYYLILGIVMIIESGGKKNGKIKIH